MTRKSIIAIILVFFFLPKNSSAQTDPVYTALNNLDFNNYLNKPIDSLLAAVPLFLPAQATIYGHLDNDKAKYLVIKYPNKVELVVRPKRFQIMNPVDANHVWDFGLFKKETAWLIELRYEGWGVKNVIAY